MEGDILNIGAGLAIGLGAIGPAIGIGMLASKAMEAVTKGFKKQAEISRAEKKVRETREAEKSTGLGAFGRNTAAFFTFGFVILISGIHKRSF